MPEPGRLRAWALFRANERHAQQVDDPGLDLEGFATVRDALRIIGHRFGIGQGETYYLHPDRAGDRQYTRWHDLDKTTGYALVWLAVNHPDTPPGWQPDATSAPDERWTRRGLLGVVRHRF